MHSNRRQDIKDTMIVGLVSNTLDDCLTSDKERGVKELDFGPSRWHLTRQCDEALGSLASSWW